MISVECTTRRRHGDTKGRVSHLTYAHLTRMSTRHRNATVGSSTTHSAAAFSHAWRPRL